MMVCWCITSHFFLFLNNLDTEVESEVLVLASVNWMARLLAHSLQFANVTKKKWCFVFDIFFPGTFHSIHGTVLAVGKIYAWLVKTTFSNKKTVLGYAASSCIFQQDVDMAPRLGGSRGSKGDKKGWESGTRNCIFSPFDGLQQLHPGKLR